MIKAGLGDKGLIMPEDWDSLDEDTKQARLDGVIKMMSNKEKDTARYDEEGNEVEVL